MSVELLKASAVELVEKKKFLDSAIENTLHHLKDKSIPLQERWEVYTTLVEDNIINNNDPYGDGFIDVLGSNLTPYDHFYVEKHQTFSFTSVYETIMDADEEWNKDLFEAREKNLEAWQEAVLQSGYSSFTYDW